MKLDLIVKNGRVVTATDDFVGDIGVAGEKIVQLGSALKSDGAREIDASGRLVIPGGIDPHTHFDMPCGGDLTTSDDFETGTKAAAFGGTTTIIDFANQLKGESPRKALDDYFQRTEARTCIDFGFHVTMTDISGSFLNEMDEFVDMGITSFKVFMAYPHMIMDDGMHFRVMEKAGQSGSVVMMHAENGPVIDQLVKKAAESGRTQPVYHGRSRAARMEAEATHRAIAIAEMAGAPIYIVHLTCSAALDEVISARQKGLTAMCETCPQYLFRDISNYEEEFPASARYIMSPPLREKWNQEILWRGLNLGHIHCVGSDHAPFLLKGQKDKGKNDFRKISNGAPTVENRMSLLYTGGVAAGRLSLNRFVEITSTRAAKIFGLFPKKGAIAPGSDADIVILDTERKETISLKNPVTHHMNVDYSVFEGIEVTGIPEAVLSRGEVIVENGEFKGKAGRGQFQKRKPFSEPIHSSYFSTI